jgi:hypothetical protein
MTDAACLADAPVASRIRPACAWLYCWASQFDHVAHFARHPLVAEVWSRYQ